MAWKRRIPFGYRMSQKQIVFKEAEAEIVRQIFSRYLSGCSLGQIAHDMSEQGIHYHAEADTWNKNMVKRILENDRYLGNEDYPPLVSADDFLAVRLLKADKNRAIKICPERVKQMGRITMCAVCGSKMQRHSNGCKATHWTCQNENCRETVILEDDRYCAGVDQCLKELALSPKLLTVSDSEQPYKNTNAFRIENELTAAFNRGVESATYMKTLIFALAAERYRALPDLTVRYKARELQELLENSSDETVNLDFIREKAVHRILLRRGASVAVELINGKIITTDGKKAEQ